MNDQRPKKFRISDAPIHRIQTLVISLQEALESFEPFKSVQAAFFVRRDFDTRLKHIGPVFNATFYSPKIHEHYLSLNYSQPTKQQLEALHRKALNSAGTPRAALERAVRRLKEMAKNASNPTKAEKIESAHYWLELYSRVTYRGGLPGFLVDKYKAQHRIPLLDLIAARKRPNTKDEWDDFVLKLKNGKIVLPAEGTWEKQPPLTCKDVVTESEEDIADPLYQTLQRWVERNEDPTSNASNDSSITPRLLLLFALPIYEDLTFGSDAKAFQHGAFLGFLFLLLPSPKEWNGSDEGVIGARSAFSKAKKMLPQIAPLLNHFAASLLESEFEEILREDYTGGDPFKFVADTIPRIDGWNLQTAPSIKGPLEIDLRQNVFANATDSEIAQANPTDDWTLLPETNSSDFHIKIERRFRHYLKATKLHRQERLSAQSQGSIASKHDYSKDLNSNDIRMDRYERQVKQERGKLQTLIENTAALETTDAGGTAKSSVVEGLKEVHREYGVPMLDLMALTRYQMMRQKAKDAGSLYEEPQFCVERLIDGTKNDVVRVVNLLVWMRSPEWMDPTRAPQENGRDFAAWGRIFAYETVASSHLSRIADHMFRELGFQLEELNYYFPRPLLRCLVPQGGGEGEPALTEPFLWPQHDGNPVRPHLFGFFPLFVEAMRAAYLHAYAATLDGVLAIGRKHDVPRRAVGVVHPFQQFITLRPTWRLEGDGRVWDYRLQISFSGPASLAVPSAATLPLGDWHRESACFQKLVSQWQSSVTSAVTIRQQAPAFSITIASH